MRGGPTLMEINTEGDGEGRRPRRQTSEAPINPAAAPSLQDGPSGCAQGQKSLSENKMYAERKRCCEAEPYLLGRCGHKSDVHATPDNLV